jgi:hypothetical protein
MGLPFFFATGQIVQNEEDVMERDKVFAGKTAIVTGASSGIGRATNVTLARVGASIGKLLHIIFG